MNAKSPTTTDEEIGKRIRARRLELKMSQTDLGDALGVTFQQVQKYEKGTNRVSPGRIINIAKTLNIGVSVLMGVNEAGKTTPAEPTALTLVTSRDGQRLAMAFNRITDTKQRAAIVNIAEQVAGTYRMQAAE